MVNGREVAECLDQLFYPDDGLCFLERYGMFQPGRTKYIFKSFQNNLGRIDTLNMSML